MENEKNFLQHFFNVGIGTIVNILLGLFTTPLLTRIVDPAEFGKFQIFNTYADLALAVCFLGLDNGIVRFFYVSNKMDDRRSLLKLCFVSPILAAALITITYVLLFNFGIIKTTLNTHIIMLLCVYIFVNIWDRFSTLLLRLTYKSKDYSLCLVIQKIVYCIIVLFYIFAIKQKDIMVLVVSSTLSILSSAIFATYKTKENWNFINVDYPKNKKDIFKYSLPLILFVGIDALLDSVDKLTIEAYCSDYEVGIYGSALALVAIFITAKRVFSTIWLPMQTEHYNQDEEGKEFIQKGNRYVTVIMFFIGVNIVFFKDIICFILGESYRNANQLLPFLFLGQTMYAISDTTVSGIDYSKKSYLHIVSGGIALFVDVILNNILVPRTGIKGAALSKCVALFVFYALRTHFSVKNYYIDYKTKQTISLFSIIFIYSYLATYYSNIIINVILYIVIMIIFVIAYKKEMIEMLKKLLDLINNKKRH